jgi:nucleoside-diphosphate-sugar epimerase
VPGDLTDRATLWRAARDADAVIHAAFAGGDSGVAVEQAAVATLVDAVVGTGAQLVYTSGIGVLGDSGGRVVDEESPGDTPPGMRWRRDLEDVVCHAGGTALRPGLVFGHGGNEILRTLIRVARRRGAAYVAPGESHWPNVHVDNLAEAYLLALGDRARGTVFNLVAGHATPRAVMEAIGQMLAQPGARALSPAVARAELPFTDWITTDLHVSSERAREVLGWRTTGPDLVDDLRHGSYAESWR